uniref:Macaca fascicularis brain cDNA clone: QflA-16101, similar to human hypothetical protein KIAA1924 (KIAA1924), mRNA, RefSeq: NM_153239.2 n=1 Tax=Macaca fascicularis TaxID=9541 RepID=I7GB88_MACFA|nr:unnamed protein product [Macaca fascicularis]
MRIDKINDHTIFLGHVRSDIPCSSKIQNILDEAQWLMPVIPAHFVGEDGRIAWALEFETILSNVMRLCLYKKFLKLSQEW